ncbi:hypothetical protein PV328_007765 [Microctonus aethiopoides]|uniref:Uncharacterized protein n=1 Tax=Microctonus aethiopoides TaxID=144406 RepID=A0AA39C9K2_9HYME|nr:hypothetical protein PV328_007765 [Microctonus aethiopoides]
MDDQNAATAKPLSLVWIENEFREKIFSIVPTVYVFIKRSNDSKYRNVCSNEKIKFGEVKVLVGMTNKTMKFVIFGDSYEKLNDVAKLCDRTAKPKRIKFVKRLTFSPPKRETAKVKIVPSGSSNATKKTKQKKENFLKKKTKSTPREHAEEDGDNFFLPKIMRVENNFEKTNSDLSSITKTKNGKTNS